MTVTQLSPSNIDFDKSKTLDLGSRFKDTSGDLVARRPHLIKPNEPEENIQEIRRGGEEEKERTSFRSGAGSLESPLGSINLSLIDSYIISPAV